MGADKFRLNTSNQRGMNPKKRHEVSQMTRLVNAVCQDSGCNRIVDVGAGLVSNHRKSYCSSSVKSLQLSGPFFGGQF